MYKLCLGSIFKLLNLLVSKGNQKHLYKALFLSNDDPKYLDDSAISDQKSGLKQIDGALVNHIKEFSADELAAKYREVMPKFIPKNERPKVVLALKKIVSDDSSIDLDTILGDAHYTKRSFLDITRFDFYHLLASLVLYGCEINSNTYKKYIVKINKNIFSLDESELSKISFISDTITEIPTPLTTTAVNENFKNVFKEIKPGKYGINIKAKNYIKLFRVNTINNKFRLKSLEEFLSEQIDHFALSRVKWNDLYEKKKVRQIISETKKSLNGLTHEEIFSQLMLYSFMECVLHAPKLFNAFQKTDQFGNKICNSGTFFIPKGAIENNTNNHLVYGSSKVENSIFEAVDKATTQAKNIMDNIESERCNIENGLVNTYSANSVFSQNELVYLKKVIIPSEAEKDDDLAIDSIGMFVCYSTDLSQLKSETVSNFNNHLEERLDNEIIEFLPKLENFIRNKDLSNKQIFLFFLPLENAIEDSNSIILSVKEFK